MLGSRPAKEVSLRSCDLLCMFNICSSQGKDEIAIFTASKQVDAGKSAQKSDGWNNKIRVAKIEVGPCRHQAMARQEVAQ